MGADVNRTGPPIINTTWQEDWCPELIGTLVFVVRGEDVLLIHKKTGHGAGMINGPGGKWQPGESIVDCAIRELAEEVGLHTTDTQCGAELRFVERNGQQWLGYAFVVNQFKGTPVETIEAKPFWCRCDEIPYDQMWADDAIWLPILLAGKPGFVGDFLFDDGLLLDQKIFPAQAFSLDLEQPWQ